uniref:TRAF3 interacting protein 3 n=1 Tax=Xenopus tropicalis TaxID=8364 RepID=A0A6I8PN20_XENTR
MFMEPSKSPTAQKQERFEDKLERRLECHEILRSRYNITSCRQDTPSWGREQDNQGQSLRQQEFFKRRHLWAEGLEGRRIRSPPKFQKYIRYSSLKHSTHLQSINTDHGLSENNKLSRKHNHSKTYPFDYKGLNLDTLNKGSQWDSAHDLINRNKMSTREKGVQTSQSLTGLTSICIKRDSSQQTDCATSVLNGMIRSQTGRKNTELCKDCSHNASLLHRDQDQGGYLSCCVKSGVKHYQYELLELSEYLVEALHRERKLKKKLCSLQELFRTLLQTSEKSFKAQVNEDKLKCKVAVLEKQLFIYSQNFPKTSVKKVLLEMEEEKQRYEEKAKESLQKLTEDKFSAEKNLENTKVSLAVTSGECDIWKEEYEKLKMDWSELTNKHSELKNELFVLQSKLQWIETKDLQMQQLYSHLQSLEREKTELEALNEQLQEDNEQKKERLYSMEVRLRNAEVLKLEMEIKMNDLQNEGLAMNLIKSSMVTHNIGTLNIERAPTQQLQEDTVKLLTEKLTAKEKECEYLQTEMDSLTEEFQSCQRKLRQCREELRGTHNQKPKRKCSFWTPLLVLIFAVVTMFLFSANMEYFIQ